MFVVYPQPALHVEARESPVDRNKGCEIEAAIQVVEARESPVDRNFNLAVSAAVTIRRGSREPCGLK